LINSSKGKLTREEVTKMAKNLSLIQNKATYKRHNLISQYSPVINNSKNNKEIALENMK